MDVEVQKGFVEEIATTSPSDTSLREEGEQSLWRWMRVECGSKKGFVGRLPHCASLVQNNSDTSLRGKSTKQSPL